MRNGMAIRMVNPSGRIGMMRLVYSNLEGKGGGPEFLPASPEKDPVIVKIEKAKNANALKDIIIRQQSEISSLKQLIARLERRNTVSIVHIDKVEHLHTSLNEVLSGNVRFSYKAGNCVKNVHLVLVPDKEIKEALKRIKFRKVLTEKKENPTPPEP